jgi:addiction module RelB/DinJ family antitoxin
MATPTTLFRARVPKARLQRAEKILARLGIKPTDAVNMLLAQIEMRQDMPFAVTAHPKPLLTPDEQATAWNQSLGEY